MKVTLIAPPIMDEVDRELRPIAMDAARECPPYGVYLLHAVLTAAGYDVALVDLIEDGTHRIDRHVDDIRGADLIGISSTSLSWPAAIRVIEQVRAESSAVPIVLGGIHPTMFDAYILHTQPVNYVVRGEGEVALLRLCQALTGGIGLEQVPNLSWLDANGDFHRNASAEKIPPEELGATPVPDFGRLTPGLYTGLSIESSRGCAFDCAFCSTSYRRSYRTLDASTFVNRLEHILPHLGKTRFGIIHIVDDEFSLDMTRSLAIVEEMKRRGLDVRFAYDSRANDLLKPGYVDAMAPFTHQFLVGAECGYDEGLQKIGKGTTCEKLTQAAEALHRAGVAGRADFSFILGLPWETMTEVQKTIRFAFRLLTQFGVRILLQWFVQIPGSRLWQDARDREVVNEAMYDDFGFFRNLHLFRTGVPLMPSEVWDVTELVGQLTWLASLKYPNERMVEYGHPEPVGIFYPKQWLKASDVSLTLLREVARPGSENVVVA